MMTDKICPKCGSGDTMMIANYLGKLFDKTVPISMVAPDVLNAGTQYHPTGPPLVQFICNRCGIWFAIFTLPEDDK